MIRVAVVLIGLLLLGAGAYGGFVFRRNQLGIQTQAQPGWCCMKQRGVCIAVKDMQSCRDQKGSVFNWNPDICVSLCGRK